MSHHETPTLTRREACAALAATGLASLLGSLIAQAQEHAPAAARPAIDLSRTQLFRFSDMKASTNANGGWGRSIIRDTLPTGEFLEVHETMLPPGKMPHLPHKHNNSEFLLIRQGQLQYLHDGGKELLGPRDVIYTASMKPHGLLNVGTTPAIYYVVSLGAQNGATQVTLAP